MERELGLPDELTHKAPSDGMSGMTDEQKLGFTYDELEKVAQGKTDGIAPEVVEKIQKQISTMAFKKELLNLPKFMPL